MGKIKQSMIPDESGMFEADVAAYRAYPRKTVVTEQHDHFVNIWAAAKAICDTFPNDPHLEILRERVDAWVEWDALYCRRLDAALEAAFGPVWRCEACNGLQRGKPAVSRPDGDFCEDCTCG